MNKTFDRYLSIVLIAFSAAFMVESKRIWGGSIGSSIGPGVLPMCLSIALVLLCILNFYQTFRVKYPDGKKEKLEYKRFIIIFVAATLYCLLIEPIGYVISSFLFLLVGFQVMERGKIWFSVILAAGVPYLVYYLYVDVMKGTLPGLPEWLGL